MATRLSEALVNDALTRLGGWSGDDHAIHRAFVLDAAGMQRLCGDIDLLARSTGHPICVDETADGMDVTLSTDDVEGVSEIDIALATRINDLSSGSAARHIPRQQRQAQLNVQVTSESAGADGDEREWWVHKDRAEPLMGVPATEAGLMPIPLPDTAPDEPEPGIEPEQELGAGQGMGFNMRGAGDAPDPD